VTSEWNPNIGLDYNILNQSFHNQIIKITNAKIKKKSQSNSENRIQIFLDYVGSKENILF
jgi:hypothetical protein